MKLFLTFITSAGNEENLRELIEPIKEHIDGVVATFHYPIDDGATYLESVKGVGKVIYRNWIHRHDVSMNETLWAGVIQDGDGVLVVDTLERAQPDFVSKIKTELLPLMTANNVSAISYFGKVFLFKYDEFLKYAGSPHWGLTGLPGGIVEYSQLEPDENKVRLNVRPTKRPDKWHFVRHYMGYWMYPPGSNHALLGLDTYGDPAKLYPIREAARLRFKAEVRNRGFPQTVDGVKQMLSGPIDDTLKGFINGDKVVNDFYHREILGSDKVIHSHLPTDIIKIT